MALDSEHPFSFAEFTIARDSDGTPVLNQQSYVLGLKVLPEDVNYSDFAWIKIKLEKQSHSSLDCVFEISQFSQVTKTYFQENRQW